MNPYFLTVAVAAAARNRCSCSKCGRLLSKESKVGTCARCRSQAFRHKGDTEVSLSNRLLIVGVIATLIGLAVIVVSAT